MTHRFQTTRWSLVLAAGEIGTPEAREALSSLCEAYWYPLYAFVRRQGIGADEASDLTQAYFLALLEKNYLADVKPDAGRFRSFLLTSLKHFLSKEWERARTLKRGGGRARLSVDVTGAENRFLAELTETTTAEALFERQWAVTVLERTLERLEAEFTGAGKANQFEGLRPHLTGDGQAKPYRELAAQRGTSEGAVKVAVHRGRRRFGELLRAEIAETVASTDDVDSEVRYLLQVLQG